jgi:hypothetical protein
MYQRLAWLSPWLFALGMCCVIPFPAAAAVTVPSPVAIRLPASTDTGVATLRVSSDSPESLLLSAGALVDKATQESLPGTVGFEPATLEVESGRTYEIKVTVTQILFEGEAEVDILNQGAPIGSLLVTRAPLAVQLVDPHAVFRRGEKTAVTLQNDARYPYDLRWMVQIGVHKYCGAGAACEAVATWSPVVLPPKDRATIDIEPPPAWFDRVGRFSEVRQDATLWLAFPGGQLPKRTLPLQAHVQGRSYPPQTLWIFIFLTIGALSSLIVRHWVPNSQRKRDLKEHIRELRLKIDGFSDDISADLRVQTRVQCHLLDIVRKSTWTIMPDYATVAAQCTQGITMLARRAHLIEEIDSVCEKQRVKWDMSPPPSQIDRVEELLRSASEGLRKTQPTEAEFIAIKKHIDDANALTDVMGMADQAFGTALAARVQAVRDELHLFQNKKAYQDLATALPGVFEMLQETPPAAAPGGTAGGGPAGDQAIPPLRYSPVDYNLSALALCRDYIWLVEGTQDVPLLEKLAKDVKPTFLQHLARHSWSELRRARTLLKQFREDIDAGQVWGAIQAGKAAMYIAYEPADIYYQQLVQFHTCFRREELNWSAAKELIVPEWDFGDGTRERGWTTSHFFIDPRPWWERWRDGVLQICGKPRAYPPQAITVSFERTTDPPLRTTERQEQTLHEEVRIQPDPFRDQKTRTFNEFVGLLVSIAVPLVALVTGAKEQLAQNPVGGAWMIILLGFGSDAIISVFKQRVSSSS